MPRKRTEKVHLRRYYEGWPSRITACGHAIKRQWPAITLTTTDNKAECTCIRCKETVYFKLEK